MTQHPRAAGEPFQSSSSRPSTTPAADPLVYELVVQATYLPLLLRGAHLEVHGRDHVPPAGTPLILASSHRNALDPFLLARALPPHSGRRLQFMAKRELFVPVIGGIIRKGGSFPVDRGGKDVGAIRTALRILQAGGTVGIFPEGTRKPEHLRKSGAGGGPTQGTPVQRSQGGSSVHGGVALLARRGRAPILPAGIWNEGRRWVIRVGEVLEPSGNQAALLAELERQIYTLSQPLGRRWN